MAFRTDKFQTMQERIILLLKSQDKTAIELLYDHYATALYGMVLRIVHSKELAEQVMQDTFVKAWRNGENYDETKGRLFTWLLKIARNTAIDATRTSHFRQGRRTDTLNEASCPLCAAQVNSDTLDLRKLVGDMDEKYGRLIELVYFQQYTQLEVSEKIGVPLGTVKTRMRHAISTLRKSFG